MIMLKAGNEPSRWTSKAR